MTQCTADLVSLTVSGGSNRTAHSDNAHPAAISPSDTGNLSGNSDPALRVTQLDQNIKFLKEQHHLMLTSLHHEVETLRQRNRGTALLFHIISTENSF